MTVHPGKQRGLFNFARTVLNSLEFDCSATDGDDGGQCQSRSEKLRRDYQGILTDAVKRLNLRILSTYRSKDISDMENIQLLCSQLDEPLWPTLGRLILNENNDRQVLETLARILGASQIHTYKVAENTSTAYEDPSWNMTLPSTDRCLPYNGWDKLFANVSTRSRALLATTTFATSVRGHDGSRFHFGDLLALNYFKWFHVDRDGGSPGTNPDNIMELLVKGSEFSTGEIYRYVLCQILGSFHLPAEAHGYVVKNRCPLNSVSESLKKWASKAKNYRQILRVMKHTLQPMVRSIRGTGTIGDINGALDVLPYGRRRPFRLENTDPRIVACRYGLLDFWSTDCPHFSITYTNHGLGYAFNQQHMWKMFKKRPGLVEMYEEVIKSENSKEVEKEDLEKIQGVGTLFGLEILLNSTYFEMDWNNKPGEAEALVVSIGDPNNLADLRRDKLTVRQGYSYGITVIPQSIVSADDDVLDMSEKRKKCRAPQGEHGRDSGLVLFASYTQTGCLVECNLRNALEVCGCIPWDYPHPEEPLAVCGHQDLTCFEATLNRGVPTNRCQCPLDCTARSYSVQVDMRPLEVDEFCSGPGVAMFNKTMSRLNKAMMYPSYENLLSYRDDTNLQICKNEVRNLVHIDVSVPISFVQNVVKQKRTSFVDQLASLGGVVGLFTGMSLLSFFEILFWMLRCLCEARSWTLDRRGRHTSSKSRHV